MAKLQETNDEKEIVTDEVMVTGHIIPTREFDRVKRSVCLLVPGDDDHDTDTSATKQSWKASGFYVHMKLPDRDSHSRVGKKKRDIYCIMTNHHVFRMAENKNQMVAIFDHEGTDGTSIRVPLEPFHIIASSKELDYALIRVNENNMSSLGIQPIVADGQYTPEMNDRVYIFQHPKGQEKHFSSDFIRGIVRPFVEYFADTASGSSGSPVVVLRMSKLVLVAIHCKGVQSMRAPAPETWNKGVLICEILNHLDTGRYTPLASPGIPGQLESCAMRTQEPNKPVSNDVIRKISVDVAKVWMPLGRELGLADNVLDIIELDNPGSYEKCYQMFTKWKQSKVDGATYGALAVALQHPAVARADLIAKYC